MERTPTRGIPILIVTGDDSNPGELERIFREGDWKVYTKETLTLRRTKSMSRAKAILRTGEIPVVIFDQDAADGGWQEIAEYMARLAIPAALIITSKFSDERLWAEALNLGAYDVLAKPFVEEQLVRAVGLAWLHWRDREEMRLRGSWIPMATEPEHSVGGSAAHSAAS